MSKDPRVDDRSEDAFEALLLESARVTADYDADQDDLEATSQFEVADRAALRRVQGFSTQLQDISDAEYRELQLERVILVGVWTEGTAKMAENSLDELKALAQTAGSEVLDGFIQRRDKPDPATYIGSGKVSATTTRRKTKGKSCRSNCVDSRYFCSARQKQRRQSTS